MKKPISFTISGMHCRSCEMLIRDELAHLKGTADISIDHKTGAGSLTLDTDHASADEVTAAVARAGYTAKLV